MSTADWIGTAGVSVLLLAYLLLLVKAFAANSRVYISMNIVGAGLAGISAIMLNFMPFVVLELVWVIVSLVALFSRKKKA